MTSVEQRAGTAPVERSEGSRPLLAIKFPGLAVPLGTAPAPGLLSGRLGLQRLSGATLISVLHVQRPTVETDL